MNPTEVYVRRLLALGDGERAELRHKQGASLSESLEGFDLFTGLWWPLRQRSPAAPQRETSWLAAKLICQWPIPLASSDDSVLPRLLGSAERRLSARYALRFLLRFDRLLQSPMALLEPQLQWALKVVAQAVVAGSAKGLNWVQLLDDLAVWDGRPGRESKHNVRDAWARAYLASRNREGKRC